MIWIQLYLSGIACISQLFHQVSINHILCLCSLSLFMPNPELGISILSKAEFSPFLHENKNEDLLFQLVILELSIPHYFKSSLDRSFWTKEWTSIKITLEMFPYLINKSRACLIIDQLMHLTIDLISYIYIFHNV